MPSKMQKKPRKRWISRHRCNKKKFHFMSDTKWLLKQGFEVCDTLPSGFLLVSLNFGDIANVPYFNRSTKDNSLVSSKGCVAFYSNRCPYSEYHVTDSLVVSCKKNVVYRWKSSKLNRKNKPSQHRLRRQFLACL